MEVPVRLRSTARHPNQRLFIRSPKKRKIIRAGRRGGKTVGASQIAVLGLLAHKRVLYAAPTTDQVQGFWREVNRAVDQAVQLKVFRRNETEHVIEWNQQRAETSRIRAKTAWNADSLRGDYADLLILDEFQLMDENALAEVGLPMLLDNNGDLVLIYTPPSLHSRSVTKATDPRHAAKLFQRAVADPDRWLAIHFPSEENKYLPDATLALAELARDMSALAYRQEILAQDIDEIPGALWTRELLETTRVKGNMRDGVLETPAGAIRMKRIVIGVDPSGSTTNEAGVVAVGIGEDNHLYVLEDGSKLASSPDVWARSAVGLYEAFLADKLVVERNFGGDMCKATIKAISGGVNVQEVVSSRSKIVRAEPVSAKFERHEAHLVGQFPALEDELVSYVAGSSKSPNRLDAMVFAGTELAFGPRLGIFDYYQQQATAAATQVSETRVDVGQPETDAQRAARIARDAAASRETFGRMIGGLR